MSQQVLKKYQKVIREHYDLNYDPSVTQVLAELVNLKRKHRAGILDDGSQHLLSTLEVKCGFDVHDNLSVSGLKEKDE